MKFLKSLHQRLERSLPTLRLVLIALGPAAFLASLANGDRWAAVAVAMATFSAAWETYRALARKGAA